MDHFADTIRQPPNPPPHGRERHERKRKLYQSCDYCRKRRRACDAVSLGIDPFAQSTSNDGTLPTSCTTCRRADKECTFEWLRSLPMQSLPQGVRSRLGVGSHMSQQGDQSQRLARLGGNTVPGSATEDNIRPVASSDTNEQRLYSMAYVTEVSSAEHDTNASFSPDTSEYVNSNVGINMLHSSFRTSRDNGNNENQFLTGQWGEDYYSPSLNSTCSPANL
jgi:hypothetical protein